MNKPVFENVIGEQIDIGNVLEDTLAGGAAAHLPETAPAPSDDDRSHAPTLALPQDEKDGRRAIEAAREAPKSGGTIETAGPARETVARQAPERAEAALTHAGLKDEGLRSGQVSDREVNDHPAPVAPQAAASRSGLTPPTREDAAPTMAASGDVSQMAYTEFKIELNNGSENPFDLHHYNAPPLGKDIIHVDGTATTIDFLIIGHKGVDSIVGGSGNDTLIGGIGQDTLSGGSSGGFDWIDYNAEEAIFGVTTGDGVRVNLTSQTVRFSTYAGFIDIAAESARDVGGQIDKLLLIDGIVGTDRLDQIRADGLTRSVQLNGRKGDDTLVGGHHADTLDGGEGADYIDGGNGHDQIYASSGLPDGAVDEVHGGYGDDLIIAGAEDNVWGDAGNNQLFGGRAHYTGTTGVTVDMRGSAGKVFRSDGTDTLTNINWVQTGDSDDVIYGGSGSETLRGGGGWDVIYGSGGSDVIDGGDATTGAWGAELRYELLTTGAVTVDLRGQGNDGISGNGIVNKQNSIDTVRGIWNVRGGNLGDTIYGDGRGNFLAGEGGNDKVYGGGGNDEVQGDGGNDILEGGTGEDLMLGGADGDEMYGGDGNDTIHGDDYNNLVAGKDTIDGDAGNDTIYGGGDNDSIRGGADGDSLLGGAGNDSLDGGTGIDTMAGGLGDDEYHVNHESDVVTEAADQGTDTVFSAVNFSIANLTNVENIRLTGSNQITATGNARSNELHGNDSTNTLDGGAGADIMYGHDGNDTYIIDDLNDRAFEDEDGLAGGEDTIILRVQNYDKRKIDWNKIEFGKVKYEGGSFNEAPINPYLINQQQYNRTINERTTGAVAQVQSIDPDGKVGPLKYYLVNDYGGTFSIDPTTGVISVAKTDLDFESDVRLSGPFNGPKKITLQVYAREDSTDPAALSSDTVNVEIEIKNVNEKPDAPTIKSNTTLLENMGGAIAQVEATDPDNVSGPVQLITYELENNMGGRFRVDSGGVIAVTAAGAVDFEANATHDPFISAYDSVTKTRYYDLRVRAVDNGSPTPLKSDWTTVRVAFKDVNEAPAVGVAGLNYIKVGQTQVGSKVASAVQTDPDQYTEAYWKNNKFAFLVGTQLLEQDGKFRIDQNGNITLDQNLTTDDAAAGKKTLQVVVYDSNNNNIRTVKSYDVVIKSAPWSVRVEGGGTTASLDEGKGLNQSVANITADDDQSGLKYALNDPSGHFAIDEDTGTIYIVNPDGLDYETAQVKVFDVEVTVTDSDGFQTKQTIRINLQDVNEKPTGVTFDNTDIAEGTLSDVTVATAEVDDPDQNPLFRDFRYALLDDQGNEISGTDGMFYIDPDLGQLKVGAAGLPEVSVRTKITLRVKVTDEQSGEFIVRNVDFFIEPGNDAPEEPHLTIGGEISEAAPEGKTVGKVEANDPNGDPVTYVFKATGHNISQDNLFKILSDGTIVVNDFSGVDVAQNTPKDYVITASDGKVTKDGTITITITPSVANNHAPTIEVDPNTVPGATIVDTEAGLPFWNLSFRDQEINDTLKVEIDWDGGDGAFIFPPGNWNLNVSTSGSTLTVEGRQDQVTGFLRATQFSPGDFPNDQVGTDHPYSFLVRVTDNKGASSDLEFDVHVTTDNRVPSAISLQQEADVSEHAGNNTPVGILQGVDPNAGDTITVFSPYDMANNLFEIQQINGQWVVVVTGQLNFDAIPLDQRDPNNANRGYFKIYVTATDNHGETSAPIEVKVWVHNETESNNPPAIHLIGEGRTEWSVQDIHTVAPFQELLFYDADDLSNSKKVKVEISMDDLTNGKFDLPDDFAAYGVTVTGNSETGPFTVEGLQENVTAFVNRIVFNPANQHTTDPSFMTGFTVTLTDSFGSSTSQSVTVDTTVTGQAEDNDPPTITVSNTAPIPTTDYGNPVAVFANVTVADSDGDELTLTITFDSDDGTLEGLPPDAVVTSYDEDTHEITYTIKGTAARLNGLLSGPNAITFDAANRMAPSDPVTTQFFLTLHDGHQAFPVTNDQVAVVTTINGPGQNDNIYELTNPLQSFANEHPDRAQGGYDTVIVKISDHYTLADNEGIELFTAWEGLTDGIDIRGNNLGNTIVGGEHDDTLDGGSAGHDRLQGGRGNDTYVVSHANVTVEESPSVTGGHDTVRLTGNAFADGSYTLGQFLEELDASGATGAMTLNGNDFGNAITGNASSNILMGFDGYDTLDGGAGTDADVLNGGSGDDTYKIRHLGDAIVEGAGDAFDVAQIFLHEAYRLQADAQVEILRAGDDFGGVHLIGNAYSSVILGSDTANVSDTLDGGTGVGIAHILAGGDGNDTYYIVNVNDEIWGEVDDDGNRAAHGNADIAYLYRGLYATEEELQAKIAYYEAQGIESVRVLNDVMPEGPDNEHPKNVHLQSGGFAATLAENSEDATGIVVVAEDDAPAGMTYEIHPNGVFGIDAETGEITILDPTKLDREKVESYVVHVRAWDAKGLVSAWRAITINLTDVNEAADRIDFSDQKTVYVNNGAGTLVVKATAHDSDVLEANRHNFYRFHNGVGPDGTISSDGLFKIDKITGQVTVNDGVTLDNTHLGLHDLHIEAYDQAADLLVSQVFSFEVVVQDPLANQKPHNLRLTSGGTSFAVAENTGNANFDFTVTADDDKAGALTFAMDANDLFEIDEATGRIRIKENAQLNHEANATYTVTVRAKDSEGAWSDGQAIQITISDVNEGPDRIDIETKTAIRVGTEGAILVALAAAHDPDGPNSGHRKNHFKFVDGTWSDTTTEDGLFTINDAGEIVTARKVTAGDYRSHNLTVRAYDEDGNFVDKVYTVDVGPEGGGNEAPTAPTIDQAYVFEGDGEGTLIANLGSTDENGDPIEFWIVNNLGERVKNDGRFKIVNNELQVFNPLKLDAEADLFFEIKLVATDDKGGVSAEAHHQISVLDWMGESIIGDEGDNTILSYIGNDNLVGGTGKDTLSAGIGRDILEGGDGADVFIFDTDAASNNSDKIVDFKVSDGDKIHLRYDLFRLGSGNVGHTLSDAQFFKGAPASVVSGDTRIIYEKTSTFARLYYDGDGIGTRFKPQLIVEFTNEKPDLEITDFLII